jgi:hypothetical protein
MFATAAEAIDLGVLSSFTYWVESGRLLAGEHPGFAGAHQTEQRVRALVSAGIDSFLDLTEEGESTPYSGLIAAAGSTAKVVHRRRPIPDMGVPRVEQMIGTLDLLDESLRTHRATYLHCLAGAGRTGLVVAATWCGTDDRGPRSSSGAPRGNGLESSTDASGTVLDWAAGR